MFGAQLFTKGKSYVDSTSNAMTEGYVAQGGMIVTGETKEEVVEAAAFLRPASRNQHVLVFEFVGELKPPKGTLVGLDMKKTAKK